MNKIERVILVPLAAAAFIAGMVEGVIISRKLVKVKLADAALSEMEKEKAEAGAAEDGESCEAGAGVAESEDSEAGEPSL